MAKNTKKLVETSSEVTNSNMEMAVKQVHSISNNNRDINSIQDGLFQGCSRMGVGKKGPLPKICHTYPTMMKLATVIPYPKKVQKIYESRDTPLGFC